MIRFEIHGDNLTITDAIRNYIEEKIGKLERYFNDVPNAVAHVKVKTYSNSATKIEVTIPLKNVTLRAEERNDDLYAGIDLIKFGRIIPLEHALFHLCSLTYLHPLCELELIE